MHVGRTSGARRAQLARTSFTQRRTSGTLGRMRARPWILLLMVLTSVPACRREGSAKLDGRWKGVRVEGASADRRGRANAFATGTQLLARENRISIAVPGAAEEATYVVEKETDELVVVRSEADGAAPSETFELSKDGTTLKWRVDDRSIVFAKLQE